MCETKSCPAPTAASTPGTSSNAENAGADSNTAAYTLELDDYEVANLRQGLLFLREVGGDTGDWLGQILNRLPEVNWGPNKSVQDQKRDLALLVGWRQLWPSR